MPTQWEPWPWKTRARGREEPALFEQSLSLRESTRDGEPTGSMKEPAAQTILLPTTSSLKGSYCVAGTLVLTGPPACLVSVRSFRVETEASHVVLWQWAGHHLQGQWVSP